MRRLQPQQANAWVHLANPIPPAYSVALGHGRISEEMQFAVAVYGDPLLTQAPATAVSFVEAALQDGHSVPRVFFYHDAVTLAWADQLEPQIDQMIARWTEVQAEGVELAVCVGAAERRGYKSIVEQEPEEVSSSRLIPIFQLTGLGQFIDAIVQSDRFIAFAE